MSSSQVPSLSKRTLRLGDTELCAFERPGSARASKLTVLIHGGLADHRAALQLVGSVTPTGRCLLPDLRGSGSSVYAGALSFRLWADDIAAWLDGLNVSSCFIAGSSMGSGVALAFALHHPQRVAGLQLIHPVFRGSELGHAKAIRDAFRTMHAASERAKTEGIDAILKLYGALPDAIRERAVAMARSFDVDSVHATTAFLASGAQPFERLRDLEALTMPCHIVPGMDPQHPAQVAEAYRAHIPNSTLASEVVSFSDKL